MALNRGFFCFNLESYKPVFQIMFSKLVTVKPSLQDDLIEVVLDVGLFLIQDVRDKRALLVFGVNECATRMNFY